MKVRRGFVTNSSSSSFIIAKKYLTKNQILAIRNHKLLGEKLGIDYSTTDYWNIEENDDFITGDTYMDNFSMKDFLEKIGVDSSKINWGCSSFDLKDENDITFEEKSNNWEQELFKILEMEE